MIKKNAILIGCGNEIGQSICEKLLKNKINVCLVDDNEKKVKEMMELCEHIAIENEVSFLSLHCDFTSTKAVQRVIYNIIKHYNEEIDLVIFAPNGREPGDFLSINQNKFENVIQKNFLAVVQITRELLPYLKKSKNSSVCYITSLMGVSTAVDPGLNGAFSASNAALIRFSESLYKESLTYFPNVSISIALTTILEPNFTTLPSRKSGNFSSSKRKLLPKLCSLSKEDIMKLNDGKVEELFYQICTKNIQISSKKAATLVLNGIKAKKYRILVGDEVLIGDFIIRLFPELVHFEFFKRWGLHSWRIYASFFEKYLVSKLGIVAYPATLSLFVSLLNNLKAKL